MEKYQLSSALLHFSPQPNDIWTLDDATKGTFIMGATGSGKTSGSGKTIAKSFLESGMGGLILVAKQQDEKNTWIRYAKETGRLDDIIVFSEENPFRFNFLDYEMSRTDRGGGKTQNLVDLFMLIHEMGNAQEGGQKSEDRFWDSALQRLLARIIDLIKLAGEKLTTRNMYRIVSSAPLDWGVWASEDEEAKDAFLQRYAVQCLVKANEHNADADEMEFVSSFWEQEWPSLDDRTRSNIKESFLGLVEPFLSGLLAELLTTETNITPDITHDGNIIILDVPVQSYYKLGVYLQGIFKYMWQKAIERRNIEEKPLPNFLWVDEAQLFLNKHDALFQSVCRSSRCCTVYLTQNISNVYSVIGGFRPKDKADSLLGNFNTKIFHAQNDTITTEWAAQTIGRSFQMIGNFSANIDKQASNAGASEQLHYQVLPLEFTTLRTGSPLHDYQVDAIITVAGRTWGNGMNHLRVSFDQRV